MSEKLQIFRNPYFLLLLGVGIFMSFFVVAFIVIQSDRNTGESSPTPSQQNPENPSGLPPIENINSYIDKESSAQPLTKEEQKYPEATPQAFPGADTTKTGTLIVISDPPNINVVLEQSTEEEVSGYKLPYNTAPFKATGVPVGTYVITAAKEGYEYTGESFKIEENKVTRALIKLAPLR